MIIVLGFFLIFVYAFGNGIVVSNIIYYFILLRKGLSEHIRITKKRKTNLLFLLFVTWVVISTFKYALSLNEFGIRNVLQLLFTLQYFVLIVDLNINIEKLEKWLFRFSILMSVEILILFILIVNVRFFDLYSTERMWGLKYIPGWPNSTPIPLLFGLFLSFKNRKSLSYSLLIIVALILTSSRGALLGITVIISYFVFKNMRYNKKKWIYVFLPFTLLIILSGNSILNSLYTHAPGMEHRMTLVYDREDIFLTTIAYVSKRPIWGYGGNTIDQLVKTYGNVSRLHVDWEQTHNWMLDMLLRYGVGGLILFTGFIISVLFNIKNKDKRFMFLLLLILSLFQLYMRNFSIVFLMAYLTMEPRDLIKQKRVNLLEIDGYK